MNFEGLIRAQLQEGVSLENLAEELGNTLNKIQAENNRPKKSEKDEYLENLETLFHKHWINEHLDMHDLTAIAVLIMQGSYPNWTVKDMQEFRETVDKNIHTAAELQGKSFSEMLGSIGKIFESLEGDTSALKGKREKSIEESLRDWINKL